MYIQKNYEILQRVSRFGFKPVAELQAGSTAEALTKAKDMGYKEHIVKIKSVQ